MSTLAYLATFTILATYARLKRNPTHFNLANALGAIPIVIHAISVQAYPQAILSASFGLIGVWNLYR